MCDGVHNDTTTIITEFPLPLLHPSPIPPRHNPHSNIGNHSPPWDPFPYTGTENCGKTNHLHRLLRTRDESERVFTYLRLQLGGGDFRILEEVLWACIAFPDE